MPPSAQSLSSEAFYLLLERLFGLPFTPSQQKAALLLSHFVSTRRERPACILRGYAGTGKTTLVAALVRSLRECGRPVVLLAPTGRAAKVFSRMAGEPAYTIHRLIYRQETFNGLDTRFDLGLNRLHGAVFIVDEASMIGRGVGAGVDSLFGSGDLLDDLISYVYHSPSCRLLLVGDTAQLPPVGESLSAALSEDRLRRYGLLVGSADLTDVVRQQERSSVVTEATLLRELLADPAFTGTPSLRTDPHGEVRPLPADELIEQLVSDYRRVGTDEVIVVTRSNRRAVLYNNGIRARIFDREDLLTAGDRVMIVRNNYYWAERLAAQLPEGETLPFSFLANGDMAEVVRIRHVHEQHGFRFGEAVLRLPDYDDYEISCRVLLSTLQSEAPALTRPESESLYASVLADYAHLPLKRDRMKALRADPYYNALQLKYAYAVTCHKAQGGQWARVYVDQGFLPDDEQPHAYLRWLYTALTRTTDRVYLVGCRASSD